MLSNSQALSEINGELRVYAVAEQSLVAGNLNNGKKQSILTAAAPRTSSRTSNLVYRVASRRYPLVNLHVFTFI